MHLIKSLFRNYLRDPEFLRRRGSLQEIPIFRELNSAQLTRVLATLYHRNYQHGEAIFREGDIGRALFIIETGRIKLVRKVNGGGEVELAVLSGGEFFGEMALLEEMPRSASAVAAEPCSLFLLYKSSLDAFIYQRPDIGATILSALAKLLSRRIREINMRLATSAPLNGQSLKQVNEEK